MFDFDGVVLDSEAANFDVWADVYRDHGCELTVADYLAAMGGRSFNLYDLLVSRSGIDVLPEHELRASKNARHVAAVSEMLPNPGVEKWIADARALGLAVGIASSADRPWIEGHLTRMCITDLFDHVSCWEGAVPAKPAPDVYLLACEALGVAPHEAVAIEDSPTGILAARNAGMKCVAVIHRVTETIELAADLVLPSLDAMTLEEALVALAS